MRITAVTPQQHDADRVSIFVDDQFAAGCHALVWLESGLGVGDSVTAEQIAALDDAEAVHTLKDRALKLLAGRPRSRAELERRLVRGTPAHPAPPQAQVQRALDAIAALGLLDDDAFAAFWVEQRDRFRPKGATALRAELRQRGVDRAAIEAAVTPDRDLERAVEAARPRAARFAGRSGGDFRAFRDHLGPFLVRRGFTYDTARQAVAQLWRDVGGDVGHDDGASDTE